MSKGKKTGRRARAVSLWLEEGDIQELKTIAHEKGLGHTVLIRMWVKEKLKELKSGDGQGPS